MNNFNQKHGSEVLNVEVHLPTSAGPIFSFHKNNLSDVPVKGDWLELSNDELGYSTTEDTELNYFEVEKRIIGNDMIFLFCREETPN